MFLLLCVCAFYYKVRTELVRNLEDRKFLMAVHKVAVNGKTVCMSGDFRGVIVFFVILVVGRTPVEGAATSLNCAVNSQLNSQQHFYYDSCRPKLSSSNSRLGNVVGCELVLIKKTELIMSCVRFSPSFPPSLLN